MTKDVNEQVEAEEMGEEMDLEVEGAAPRRKRGGFWAVMTLIFVVVSGVLGWLYTIQVDELAALRAEADQASGQVVRLQQANRQIKAELNGLVDKLREVVKVVEGLEGVEEAQPAAEEAAAEGKEPAAEAKPAEAATEAAESQPAEEAESAEEPQPRAPEPRMGPGSPRR